MTNDDIDLISCAQYIAIQVIKNHEIEGYEYPVLINYGYSKLNVRHPLHSYMRSMGGGAGGGFPGKIPLGAGVQVARKQYKWVDTP